MTWQEACDELDERTTPGGRVTKEETMAFNVAEYQQILLDGAPEQVKFVVLERCEEEGGYMCYYTVARDPKEPRVYRWRRARIDFEALVKTKDASPFWDTQPKAFNFAHLFYGVLPEGDRLWVERQIGKRQGLELLMEHCGLGFDALHNACSEYFGWDPNAGVFTLLPEEIEKQPEIARELLIKHLQKTGDGSTRQALT